jgi:2-dehydropantoate 2-reductase
VASLAAAEGVSLPPDIVEQISAFAHSLEPASFSSLYDDLVRSRRMELEALHGFVVRRAAQHGLDAPMCETIYALLKPHAVRNEAGQRGAASVATS